MLGPLRLVPRFLIGDANAIRELAGERSSLWLGALLVVTAGIAREYDHERLATGVVPLVLPLLASFAAAGLVYGSLKLFVLRDSERPSGRFRVFLALFWLTAPLAWIYAVPVERLLAAVPAALCNIAMLACVATWRVVLISRVIAVLFGADFRRALGAVGMASSLLAFLLSLAAPFTLVPLMAGLAIAAETQVVVTASRFVTSGSILLAMFSIALLGWSENRPTAALPPPQPGRLPALAIAALFAFWIAVSIGPQLDLERHDELSSMIRTGSYREVIDELSRHERGDYPFTRRIPPDPYRGGSLVELPELVRELRASDARWVRELYTGYVAVHVGSQSHHIGDERLLGYLVSLARLPEGAAFAAEYRVELEQLAQDAGPEHRRAMLEALTTLLAGRG